MIDGPVTNRRFSRRTVRNAVLVSVCVLVIFVVGGGGWALYSKISADTEKTEREARDMMARNIATQVQKSLGLVRDKLAALARDEQTIELFQQNVDDATLLVTAEEKQPLFDQALKLRYLKPGAYQYDEASVPPLSYASLDMLNKVETTSQINAEVHLFGTPNQHIVMIERVVNNAYELIGILHLSLDVSLFEGMMKDLGLNDEYVELTQRAAGKTLVLAKSGDASVRQGPAITVSVNDTRWIIAYWSGTSSVVAEDEASSGLPLLPIVLVLLVIAGGVYFVMQKRGSSSADSDDDLISYEGAVRAIAEGAHAGVEHMIPHLPKGERITANLKPVSKGINTDDATMIATPPDAAATPTANMTASESEVTTESVTTETAPASEQNNTAKETEQLQIAPVIFRAYDIRGIVGETFTEAAVYEIARAIGTMAHKRGQQGIAVARDGRTSSPELCEALIKGLRSTGRDVIDIGSGANAGTVFCNTSSGNWQWCNGYRQP